MYPQYRLLKPILSIYVSEDQQDKLFQYVPAGAVIYVLEEQPVNGVLLSAQWESKTVWMFQQDIESRAELLTELVIIPVLVGKAATLAVN